MDDLSISDEDKAKLRAIHNSLNPLVLKRELDALRDKLSKMVDMRRRDRMK